MSLEVTTAGLPPLYSRWIDQLLGGGEIPAETAASCDDCAMLPPPDGPADGGHYFHPRIKCCTYLPTLPNYLVGRILADEDRASAAGRASVEARLAAGVAVTPLGLGSAPVHGLLYQHGAAAFGKSLTLRCPHYLEAEGSCGIWRHRAAVCATWFCKYQRGAVGMAFWRALHQLLEEIEASLSRRFVFELDVGTDALRALFPPLRPGPRGRSLDANAIDGVSDPEAQRRVWGSWHGREAGFYAACAERVEQLSLEDVVRLSGPEVQIHAHLVREAHRRLLDDSLPAAVRPGPFRLVKIGRRSDRVVAYSAYDPLDLPRPILRLLGHFDGRPTDEALATIAAEEKIRVNRSLVRLLLDFGLLVPAGG